jgi:hypothetical protein
MPTRILALCGFTQNAFIYSKQVRRLSGVPAKVPMPIFMPMSHAYAPCARARTHLCVVWTAGAMSPTH